MTDLKAELQKLYADASKHSVYQNVPDFVSAELGYIERIDEGWRGDRPRLAYLLAVRKPAPNETWIDFGANTGFFTLSLAHRFPHSTFVAVEAHAHHAEFIRRVARHFRMSNVKVIQRAVGLRELSSLPQADFLLHLNVLHHAGADFDADLVPARSRFPQYAVEYLAGLGECTSDMLFQLGSNWGGDKQQPLVGVRDDAEKLRTFTGWLRGAGWQPEAIAYASRQGRDSIVYENLDPTVVRKLADGDAQASAGCDWHGLDDFPGEFYRRPLFVCRGGSVNGNAGRASTTPP